VKTRDTGLLEQAIATLEKNTGLTIEIVHYLHEHKEIDATAILSTGTTTIPLAIELKTRVTNALIGNLVYQFDQATEQGLLIADYINPRMAERLKTMNIWFLDAVGNTYINAKPVFIYIKGNKAPEKPTAKTLQRAFRPSGLKLTYALLCNPELVNQPYRNIAQAAEVALGTVGWVIKDLIEIDHIVDMGERGRRLKNRKKLLERWLIAYPEQLRPKLETGRYRALDPDWWQTAPLHNLQAYWGAEVAADRLTHYLKPEIITIYVMKAWAGKLKLTNKLRKDPNGDVEILNTFWDVEHELNRTDTVNPILIYADLMASGDPRNIETAQIIYDQELAEHFRED
jgi:hypothetical protein